MSPTHGGTLTITGSTVSGNRTGRYGGGIYNTGTTTVRGSTIFGNTADNFAGGIYNAGHVELVSSILFANSGTQFGQGLSGPTSTASYSIFQGGVPGSTTDGGNNLSDNPFLGPLQDNGGPTETHFLNGLSPAIDAGSCSGQTVDQRGETRPYDAVDASFPDAGDACDIGAVELQSGDVVTINCSGVCYVDASASGTNTGQSWTNATPRLQDALAVAEAGDQIWVADGTYYADEGGYATDDARTSSFRLKSGVALYGGFAGGETTLDARNVASYVATLSGDLTQNDVGNFGNNGENAVHVVTAINVDSTGILDGFTIKGGHANGPTDWAPESAGGGVYIENGNPVLNALSIVQNYARHRGGGINIEVWSAQAHQQQRCWQRVIQLQWLGRRHPCRQCIWLH